MSPNEMISIKSHDGLSSRIRIYRTNESKAPVIICMPAMGVAARHYNAFVEKMINWGWNVITADLRGNGESAIRPERKINFGYHEMVAYDWPAIISKAALLFPRSKIILLGHSLGGQLSALYMAQFPGEVSGLILVAAPLVYHKCWDFPISHVFLFFALFCRYVSIILGYFPGHYIGFGNIEAKGVIKDWINAVKTGRYQPENALCDYEALFPNIIEPVLSISFSDDLFAPERAVDGLCQKLSNAKITRWHLTPGDINRKKIKHLGILRPCDPLLVKISDWIHLEVNKESK